MLFEKKAFGDVAMIQNINGIDQQNFNALVSNKKPTLVEFYDDVVSSCFLVESILTQVTKHFKNRIQCFRLQLRTNASIANTYRVLSSPTIIVFQDGQPIENLIGTFPKSQLFNLLKKLIS